MRHSLRFTLASASAALLLALASPAAQAQAPARAGVEEVNVAVTAASPNPVKTTARFSVSVRRAAQVRVELCNVLGQRVQTLLDDRLEAGQSRSLVISVDNLPPGLYLYRVQSDRSVVTRQVVLSR